MGKCECGRLKGNPCGPLRPNTINVTVPSAARLTPGLNRATAQDGGGAIEGLGGGQKGGLGRGLNHGDIGDDKILYRAIKEGRFTTPERATAQGRVDLRGGIVNLTGCRGSKPPYQVFRRSFTSHIFGAVSACDTLT